MIAGRSWWILLGVLLAVSCATASGSPQGRDREAPPNTWGGMHVSMDTTDQGATLDFDCAHGAVLEPIKPNAEGEFSAKGTYTPMRGGPVKKNSPPRDLPAVYKGKINGDTMQLEILLDNKELQPEPFTLTRGRTGRVMHCQ